MTALFTFIDGCKLPDEIVSSVASELNIKKLSFDSSASFSSIQFLKNLSADQNYLIAIPAVFLKTILQDSALTKKGIYWIVIDETAKLDSSVFQSFQSGQIFSIVENPVTLLQLKTVILSAMKDFGKAERIEKLYAQFINQQNNLRKLTNIGIALSNEPDIETLLDSILDIAMELTDSDSGTLYFIEQRKNEDESKKLRFIYTKNNSIDVPFQNLVMDVSNESISGFCALSGKTLNIPDVGKIPNGESYKFNDKFDQSIGYRSKSMLVTPLKNYQKEIIGVLQLINKKQTSATKLTNQELVDMQVIPYTEFDINLIESFGSQAAIAVENKNLVARIQDQLRQVQIVQEEKMNSLVTLVAGVAHEINNPVNFISSSIVPLRRDVDDIKSVMQFLEILSSIDMEEFNAFQVPESWAPYKEAVIKLSKAVKDQELKPSIDEIEDLLNGIEKGSSRITEIVRSLRSYTLLEEKKIAIIDINQTIDIAINSIKKEFKKAVEFKINYNDLPLIHANSELLHIALFEMIKNSVEAVENNGIIEISTSGTSKEIKVCIDDNGTGIPEHIASKIFDPFFTTKAVGKGIGMGLSIAYTIIQRHNGTLRLTEKSTSGAHFEITLPVGLLS